MKKNEEIDFTESNYEKILMAADLIEQQALDLIADKHQHAISYLVTDRSHPLFPSWQQSNGLLFKFRRDRLKNKIHDELLDDMRFIAFRYELIEAQEALLEEVNIVRELAKNNPKRRETQYNFFPKDPLDTLSVLKQGKQLLIKEENEKLEIAKEMAADLAAFDEKINNIMGPIYEQQKFKRAA